MTHWFQPADIYCERTDPGFWAEPVNALTNIAFLLAGLLLVARKQPPARLLGLLVILIGIGSFLFHTFANRLTGFLDVFFIGVYLISYAWLWPKWVMDAGVKFQVFSVCALVLSISLASVGVAATEPILPNLPPGTYLGAWFYVITLATWVASTHVRASLWLWATAGLFLVSMSARQADLPLCLQTGGTHWLWHVMNAAVLYASARALLAGAKTMRPRSDGTS